LSKGFFVCPPGVAFLTCLGDSGLECFFLTISKKNCRLVVDVRTILSRDTRVRWRPRVVWRVVRARTTISMGMINGDHRRTISRGIAWSALEHARVRPDVRIFCRTHHHTKHHLTISSKPPRSHLELPGRAPFVRRLLQEGVESIETVLYVQFADGEHHKPRGQAF